MHHHCYTTVVLLVLTFCGYSSSYGQYDKQIAQIEATNQGRYLFEEGSYKEAIIRFNETIEKDSFNVQAYYFRGKTKMIFEDLHGAMKDYNTIIGINPKFADAYYERGNVKFALQDYYGAIEDYGLAIQLNPNLVEAYYQRGKARRELEAYQDAINDFTKILDFDARNVDAYYLRGVIKIEHGLLQEGCLDLSKAGELGDLKAYETIREVCNRKEIK